MNNELMDFSQALQELIKGNTVARQSWRDRPKVLFISRGSFDFEQQAKDEEDKVLTKEEITHIDGIDINFFKEGEKNSLTQMPSIGAQYLALGMIELWHSTSGDLLASDWFIYNPEQI